MKTAYIKCPHCQQRMATHGHKQLSDKLKQLTAVCSNPNCLYSAVVNVEIAKTLQPPITR